MRRTRFMSWFFLVLSLAFFLVRDFRFALEAPLVNFVISTTPFFEPPQYPRLAKLYTLERYVSTEELRGLAAEAARQRDNDFVAFAALNLPSKGDAMRLADEATAESRLTWIYLPLIMKFKDEVKGDRASKYDVEYLQSRIEKLRAFDPENAAPHLLRAELIRVRRDKDWPEKGSPAKPEYLDALARETEWRKEMAVAFASPKYDTFGIPQFELYRKIMRQRGWDHPYVFETVWWARPIPSLLWERNYANLLVLKLGAEAEAAGRRDEALRYYWQAAQYGARMQLQGATLIEQLVATAIRLISYPRLASALKKSGQAREAEMVEETEKQLRQDTKRLGSAPAKTSNYHWSVFLIDLSARLVALFLLISLAVMFYVNAKLWVRKEKKGRLYDVCTTAENYAPLLLFLSCLALYLAFVPYGQNYAYYMSTQEAVESFPPALSQNIYPVYPSFRLDGRTYLWTGHLPLKDPFQDYAGYALAGFVLLTSGMLLARRLEARKEPLPLTGAMAAPTTRVGNVDFALYLLTAITGSIAVAMLKPWAAALFFECAVALLICGTVWLSSIYLKQSGSQQKSWVVAIITATAAYVMFFISSAIAGAAGAIFADLLKHLPRHPLDHWMLAVALFPFVISSPLAASRMRSRVLAFTVFVLTSLSIGLWIYLHL